MAGKTIAEKSFLSTFPKGQIAWSGLQDGTQKEISDGLALQVDRDRKNGQGIITDFFPDSTTLLEEWEYTFRLPTGKLLTVEQRKARLAASWTKKSPASYTGMNEIYELSGFDLIARPLLPTEDPRDIIEESADVLEYLAVCGAARCGQLSESSRCGAFQIIEGTADPLVFANGRPGDLVKNYITKCGVSRCGQLQTSSRCGNFEGSRILPPDITIPDDDVWWPLIYIIEGKDGGFAQVPAELEEAFIFLTYKIKPLFMWAIAKAEFIDGGSMS